MSNPVENHQHLKWVKANKGRATEQELQAGIILGDEENGVLVDEISELLDLKRRSVMVYLLSPKWRPYLFRRLFEETESTTSRARDIVARRRHGLVSQEEKQNWPLGRNVTPNC